MIDAIYSLQGVMFRRGNLKPLHRDANSDSLPRAGHEDIGLPEDAQCQDGSLFIHSFILRVYIAPLQDISTQRRSLR